MTSCSHYRQITFPTRFARTNGPFIHILFYKLNTSTFESIVGIFINTLSDRQPYFTLLISTEKLTVPQIHPNIFTNQRGNA